MVYVHFTWKQSTVSIILREKNCTALVYINVFGRNSDTPSISGHPKASTNHATMLRLRPCGGKAPASVHALFRARLPRPASSTAYAVAASSALEELAAERKGRPLLPTISASFHRMLVGSRLASHLIPLRAFVHMVLARRWPACWASERKREGDGILFAKMPNWGCFVFHVNAGPNCGVHDFI
jgi:hypothetical protein